MPEYLLTLDGEGDPFVPTPRAWAKLDQTPPLCRRSVGLPVLVAYAGVERLEAHLLGERDSALCSKRSGFGGQERRKSPEKRVEGSLFSYRAALTFR